MKLLIEPGLLTKRRIKFDSNELESLFDIYIVGDILGRLDETYNIANDSSSAIELLIKQAINIEDLRDLSLQDYIGSFTLIIMNKEKNTIFISSSTTSPTPFLDTSKINENTITVIFDEDYLIDTYKKDISLDVIKMISLCHQGVSRFPFQFFNLRFLHRNPSGFNLLYNINQEDIFYSTFIEGENSEKLDIKKLTCCLESILKLYQQYYKSDLAILFSGGLDSTVLAGIINNLPTSIPGFHIDYKGSKSKRSQVAQYISKELNLKTIHIPRFPKYTTEEVVTSCLTNGFMSIPNEMYFGAPINKKADFLPKYLISGQGADSLYAIDTFAPPTESVGVGRVSEIIKSHNLRLNIANMKSADKINSENNSTYDLKNLIINQCTSVNEHVPYDFSEKKSFNPIERLREKYIAEPVFNILQTSKIKNASIYTQIRFIKWLRFVANSNSQRFNNAKAQGKFRLFPYMEGPTVRLFMNYRVREFEAIAIKDSLERVFTYSTGLSHRVMVEDALEKKDWDCGIKAVPEYNNDKLLILQKNLLRHLRSKFESSKLKTEGNFFKNYTQLLRVYPFMN